MRSKLRFFVQIAASILFLAGTGTIAQTGASEGLMTLAQNKFNDFSSPAEKNAFELFFQKIADGKLI